MQRARAILEALEKHRPSVRVPLRHHDPVQLLVATILSAQCTDATVNRVTPRLFAEFPDAASLAAADRSRLEELIHATGFFRQKARAVQETCRELVARFGGQVPRTLDELTRLPGVGRKTANVILSSAALEGWPGWDVAAGGLGIVVDTHVQRLARRLALTLEKEPEKVERDLTGVIPAHEWASFPLRLIYFGREICTSRNPACARCPLFDLCPAGPHGGSMPWLAGRDGKVAHR
ncbi:endonuclease III [Limnochorda pilosa]|uniref:Endonuclease III n=1 Tax=Limnochorda pilosa TaxID=1555112 RepID=A0A0K2SHD8_LIMPI|nr:endonuclease III [Limnochorda pilosa]